MRTIRLRGYLGQEFGRAPFSFDVRTPAEAIRALLTQIPELKARILNHKGPGFHVRVGREYRDKDDVADPCGEREIINIIPATAGSGAAARTIVGAVLVVVGAIIYVYGGALGAPVMQAGLALMMGGIAELLAPKPKVSGGDADRPRSYTFGNTLNTVGQGAAVPVGYGRRLVPSHVISAQVFSDETVLDPDSPYVAPPDVLGTNTGTIDHQGGGYANDYGRWEGGGTGDQGGGDGNGNGSGPGGDSAGVGDGMGAESEF
ncbi:MAG: hypothetical protein QM639_09750 [Rhodocyclaceae bacterium]